MIPRYSRPEMAAIFSPETRLGIWLEVELAAAEAMAAIGAVPAEPCGPLAATIHRQPRAADRPRAGRGDRGASRGTTSSRSSPTSRRYAGDGGAIPPSRPDVLRPARHHARDPARARRRPDPRRSSTPLLGALERRAFEHKRTPTIGRSHGIHAEPTTFGLKLAGLLRRVQPRPPAHGAGTRRDHDLRHLRCRRHLRQRRSTGRGSMVAARFGLEPEPVSTQVIPRDRHAAFMTALALLAACDRAAGDRDPPSAADRGRRGRGAVRGGAEGQLGHAPQAQSGAVRESDRASPA